MVYYLPFLKDFGVTPPTEAAEAPRPGWYSQSRKGRGRRESGSDGGPEKTPGSTGLGWVGRVEGVDTPLKGVLRGSGYLVSG